MTFQGPEGDDPAVRGRVVASFVFFALLLAAYYLIRPVRDSLVAGIGSDSIKVLSTLVLGVSLAVAGVYAWLVSRIPRRWLVPALYGVFAVKLLSFAALFTFFPGSRLLAQCFYVWVAVFNLWMVATFWSFMADLWPAELAQRHFGRIAAGGSLGGLLGPWLARQFVHELGPTGLMTAAAILLLAAAGVSHGLMRGSARDGYLRFDAPIGGRMWDGLRDVVRSAVLRRIALLVACGSILGMMIYIEVAKSAAQLYPDPIARTAFFADRDLWVNAASLLIQFAIAPWMMRKWGVGRVLVLVSMTSLVAFGALYLAPTASVLLAFNVLLRTVEFGLGKPGRDALYTVLPTDAKYKSKNLIDTVIYRACDSLAGWMHALITPIGGGLALIAAVGVVVAGTSSVVARRLGRDFSALVRSAPP